MTIRERFLAALGGQPVDREPDPLKRELCHRIVDLCPIVLTWPSYENRYFMTPPRLNPGMARNYNRLIDVWEANSAV